MYFKGRKIKEYPKELIEKLKEEARKESNIPKEMLQLKDILDKLFLIESRIQSVGIGVIYFDKKRGILIVSGIYHLVISPRNNVKKFRDSINFLDIDARNKERLDMISNFKIDIAGTGNSRT